MLSVRLQPVLQSEASPLHSLWTGGENQPAGGGWRLQGLRSESLVQNCMVQVQRFSFDFLLPLGRTTLNLLQMIL